MKSKRPEVQLYRPPSSNNRQRGTPNKPNHEAPSSSKQGKMEEVDEKAIEDIHDLTTAYVYTNDLIMKNIIQNITNLKDRNQLELASKRLLHLSRKTGWLFPRSQNVLVMGFTTLSNAITIQIGKFFTFCPCLTMETRRINQGPNGKKSTTQSDQLLTLLSKIADRFGKYVSGIVVGGRDDYDRERGIDNHILVITEDLMKSLNRFEHLRSVQFRSCLFNNESIDFLSSSECTFHNGVTSLSMNGIYLDCDRGFNRLVMLLTESVEVLEISDTKITGFGKYLATQLEKLKMRLKKISIIITAVDDVFTATDVLSKFNNSCKEFHLHFVTNGTNANHNLFILAKNIRLWTNIRSLTINGRGMKPRDCADLSEILEDIGQLNFLENLSVGGWSDPNMIQFLIRGLKSCQKLKSFEFTNRAYQPQMSDILELIAVLPYTVMNLELSGVPLNSEVLKLIYEKYQNTLKRFVIKRPTKCFTIKCFQLIMNCFPYLEEFSLDQPIPSMLIASLIETKTIKNASVILENGCIPELEDVLADHFEIVNKHPSTLKQHAVYLELKNRKLTGTLQYSMEELKKIEGMKQEKSRRNAKKANW